MRSSSVLSPECSRLKKGLFLFSSGKCSAQKYLQNPRFKRAKERLSWAQTERQEGQKLRNAEGRRALQLNERHASKLHLVAPPNISMLPSVQEKTFPTGALLAQVAKFLISAPESFRFHMFKFASSPTYACVASKPPPSVSCGTRWRRRYCWRCVIPVTRQGGFG